MGSVPVLLRVRFGEAIGGVPNGRKRRRQWLSFVENRCHARGGLAGFGESLNRLRQREPSLRRFFEPFDRLLVPPPAIEQGLNHEPNSLRVSEPLHAAQRVESADESLDGFAARHRRTQRARVTPRRVIVGRWPSVGPLGRRHRPLGPAGPNRLRRERGILCELLVEQARPRGFWSPQHLRHRLNGFFQTSQGTLTARDLVGVLQGRQELPEHFIAEASPFSQDGLLYLRQHQYAFVPLAAETVQGQAPGPAPRVLGIDRTAGEPGSQVGQILLNRRSRHALQLLEKNLGPLLAL